MELGTDKMHCCMIFRHTAYAGNWREHRVVFSPLLIILLVNNDANCVNPTSRDKTVFYLVLMLGFLDYLQSLWKKISLSLFIKKLFVFFFKRKFCFFFVVPARRLLARAQHLARQKSRRQS